MAPSAPGSLITTPQPAVPSPTLALTGKYTTLTPLQASDAPALYTHLGGPSNASIYTYVTPYSNFTTSSGFTSFIQSLISEPAVYAYAITIPSSPSSPVGIITLEPVPLHHRAELGAIYGAPLQRSTAATEALYLLLRHAFQDLRFLRVEWKCDSRNDASCRAARRLGFVSEGLLRKHMVVEGPLIGEGKEGRRERVRRDTAWFAITDEEWGGVGGALEKWLEETNFEDGKQRKKLEDFRRESQGAGAE